MSKNKLIIKKLLVKELNYKQIEKLIRQAFSTIVDIGINAGSANITIDNIIMKKESETFSAFDGDNIVGVLIYKISGKSCYIDKLAVFPKYQSMGIGRNLINKLFIECVNLKIKKIWLYTFEYNRNIKFYESLGFYKSGYKRNSNYYFSIIYCKYFNNNRIITPLLYLKYIIEKFFYTKIFFYSPSKITIIGKFIKKIRNVFKKRNY